MSQRLWPALAILGALSIAVEAQVIEFESNGLKYQTLSKSGITVMFARLPSHLREYSIVQVTVSNGSQITSAVRPEDFTFKGQDGRTIRATPAKSVLRELIARGSRNDVIRLVSTYESTLYGIPRYQSTNGYQQRREAFLAEVPNARLKAAAAASAIALVETRLKAGESTDGAVFFATGGKPLGKGRLVVLVAGETFEFDTEPEITKSLQQR